MGQMTSALYADFAVPTGTIVTSEQAAFPATNVNSIIFPNVPYKGSAAIATTERLILDFGVATAIAAIVIDHTNSSTLVFKGKNTDTAWGSPTWTSGSKTISLDREDGRRKIYYAPTGSGSPFNYRYLAIEPGGTTTTDGSANWRVGTVLALKTVTPWLANSGYPYTPVPQWAHNPGLKPSGGGEPSAIGNRYCEIVLPTTRWQDPAQVTIYQDILAQGQHLPFVFFRNYVSDAEVYIGHRVGVTRGPSKTGPNSFGIEAIVMREAA